MTMKLRLLVGIVTVFAFANCGRRASELNTRYSLETIVSFAAGQGSERFKRGGWSRPEAVFTWTEQPTARLKFTIRPGNRPLGVRARLAGMYKHPELPFQPVLLVVNGTTVANWQVSRVADFTAVIPLHVVRRERTVEMEFRCPSAVSPQTLGVSADSRLLGISCFELEISNAALPTDMWPDLDPSPIFQRPALTSR